MESASSGASGSATVIPSLSALKSEQSRLKSERNTFQLKFAVAQRQLNDAQREILEERIEKERLVCELGDVKAELAETRSAAAALEAVEKGRTLSEADAELAEVKKVLGDRESELAGLRKQFEELKAREKEKPAKSLRQVGCQADTPPQYSESEHQINNPFAASTPSTFTNPNRKTRIIQYVGLPPFRGSRVSLTNSSGKLQRKPETITQKKVSSIQTPIHSTRPFTSISTSTNLLKRKADDDSGSDLSVEDSQKKPKTEMVRDAKKDVLKGLKFSKNRGATTTTIDLDSSTPPTLGSATTKTENSSSSSSSCSAHSVPPLPALPASTPIVIAPAPVASAPSAPTPPPTPPFHIYIKNLITSVPSSSGSSPTRSQPPTTPANLKLVVEIRRDLLASSFGVAGQQMLARISKEKNPTGGTPWDRRLLLPSLDRNPYLPSNPRQPGVFFSARSREDLGMERCSLFVKRDGRSKANEVKKKGKATPLWEYTGEYKVHWEDKLKAKWYSELDSKIQLTIEKDILKKPKHAHYRERIARRLSTRSNKAIDVKKLTLDNVKWALESGEEEINLFYLEPIGYDEFFADELMRRIRESESEVVVTGDGDGKGKSDSRNEAEGKHLQDDSVRVSAASANVKPTALPDPAPKPSLTVSTSVVDPGYGSESEVEMDLSPLSDPEAESRLRSSPSSTLASTLMDTDLERTRGSQKTHYHTDLDFDSDGELTELEDDDVDGEGDNADD